MEFRYWVQAGLLCLYGVEALLPKCLRYRHGITLPSRREELGGLLPS